MNAQDILDMIGDARGEYILQAQKHRAGTAPKQRLRVNRAVLIAAMIALTLLLVGCTIAYTQGWFVSFFQKKGDGPLTQEQISYIEENEQIIQETQTQNGWTVELKSTMCDGETGYIIFGITAPADVDLESANYNDPEHYDCIIPGNAASMVHDGRTMFSTSMGIFSEEHNIIWQYGEGWEEDNDGSANTMNYVIKIRCDKFDSNKSRLLDNPFGSDVEFYICFDNFVHAWEDEAIRDAIDAKYAGQDYMIDGEEMAGLYKSEVLVEGEWEFTIVFGTEGQSIELLSSPITVEAKVHRKIDNGTMFYDTTHGLEPISLTSFILKPLGAELMYEGDEDVIGAFFQWDRTYGYEDRFIYAVMKDGSQVALCTDSVGTNLTAESPIVLSEVDHILMGDGTVIPVPGE